MALDKRDAFPVAGKALDLASLQKWAGPGGRVRALPITAADGLPVAAYYVQHPHSRGVVLFIGGSGNQVDAPIQILGPRTAARHLDLAVFSYYQSGEAVPTVSQARAKTRAVYAAIKAMRSPAAENVYVIGHSAGGWFALDLAAQEDIRGLALVGAETTPAEVIRRTYAPWANFVVIRPDKDAEQLDASRYAPQVRAPTLLVTSRQDEAVPAVVATELLALLPAATSKHLVALDGVTHGRYFLSDDFWQQFDTFFLAGKVHPPA